MRVIRKRLSWVAAGWLMARVAAFAAAPLAFAIDAAPAGARVVTCDCPDAAPGRACPMHSGPRSGQRGTGDDNDDRCRMRGNCSPVDIAFLAFAASIGIPVAAGTLAFSESAATLVSPRTELLARYAPPDAPPPRS
jgi:hypothetical protein